MKKKHVILIVLLALVSVGLGVWFWGHSTSLPSSDTKADTPVALVQTAALGERSLARTVEAFGLVAASAEGEQAVAAPFDGVIAKVLVTPGAHVAVGATLVELVPSADARLQLDSARGALTLATRALANAKERYDLKLTADTDLIAAQQVEQDARLKVASLETRGLGGGGKIKAPVTGVVGRVDAAAGVQVATGAPLVVVVASSGLEAKLGVESMAAAGVRIGQTVSLISMGRSSLPPLIGRVTAVGAAVDGATGEVVVRVALPEGTAFFNGEHVRGKIEVERRTVTAVPRDAVAPEGDAEVLFTVKDGKAVRHEVTTGIADGDLVEVSGGGVAAGDTVVTQGNHELSDGMPVRTESEAAK